MPERFWLPLNGIDPRRVQPNHVHAAISRWFDDSAEQHRHTVKPYALSPLCESGTGLGVEVGVLAPWAARRLRETVGTGHRLRLGSQFGIARPPHRLSQATWEELGRSTGSRSWHLDFETPVFFRRGSRGTPLPTPAAILHGLTDRWNAFSPNPLPPLSAGEATEVWVSEIAGRSTPVSFARTRMSGFLGSVTLRCENPTLASRVDALLNLAEYAGCGSGTAKGFGVTRVAASRGARQEAG